MTHQSFEYELQSLMSKESSLLAPAPGPLSPPSSSSSLLSSWSWSSLLVYSSSLLVSLALSEKPPFTLLAPFGSLVCFSFMDLLFDFFFFFVYFEALPSCAGLERRIRICSTMSLCGANKEDVWYVRSYNGNGASETKSAQASILTLAEGPLPFLNPVFSWRNNACDPRNKRKHKAVTKTTNVLKIIISRRSTRFLRSTSCHNLMQVLEYLSCVYQQVPFLVTGPSPTTTRCWHDMIFAVRQKFWNEDKYIRDVYPTEIIQESSSLYL